MLAIDDAKVQDLVSGHSVLFEYLQQVLGFSVNSALLSFDIIRIQNNNRKIFVVIFNFLQISHMIKSCQYQNFISNLLHFYPGHIGQQWKSPKSQLSLFFFQFSWYLFLVRTGSVGGSGLLFSGNFEGVRYPKKNSQISSSFLSWTQERFQVLLISDHIKTFLHLPVIHSCCRILQYFMIMIFI